MSKVSPWIYHIALVLLTALLYGQFLGNPIIFDDVPFFMLDEQGGQPVSQYHWSLLELRSLPYATLAWTKEWLGLGVVNFRIGNLLLHALTVSALFSFVSGLLDAISGSRGNKGINPRLATFSAALIFALHPVATYAAGYLIQRTIIMATLFSLLALLAYMRGSVRQNNWWLWASVPLYYLAVFSKEHAIMLPCIIVALTVLLHQDWQAKIRGRWALFMSLAGIACMVLLARKGIIGSTYEINAPDMLSGMDTKAYYPLSILTQAWLFFKYLALWLLPNPEWMSVDMREPFAKALYSPYLVSLLIFVSWGIVATWMLSKRGLPGVAGFAMLFPWLMFMTEFSSVRIQEVFVLYRSYLWAPGVFCLFPVLFIKMGKQLSVAILAAIATAIFPISMERLSTFSHPLLLWDDAEKLVRGRQDLPGVYRIYYNRGTELVHFGQYDLAIADLKKAIELYPTLGDAYGNMGAAYLKKNEWVAAVAAFDKVISLTEAVGKPQDGKAYQGLGMAYEGMGEYKKAAENYDMSCKLAKRGCSKTSIEKLLSSRPTSTK